jgi:hypothetical protein
MLIIINLLICCVVLFIYIHIYKHNKTSNYLELYEMENLSKEKLEDVINFKQPLLLNNYYLAKNINMKQSDPNYSLFNVNIYNNNSTNLCKITLRDYYNIISNNNTTNYLSYNNEEFLQETVIDKILRNNDIFFRPPNVCNKNYDIIMGAKNNNTRLKYSIHNRNLLYVSSGLIEVTLCPPKYYKNLHVKKNYETMEFYSQIDIYNVESIYKNDFNKIKFLRLTLGLGQVLVIPPYWFYSIKFLEKHSFVFLNTYNTYINVISTLPYICMQILQLGNIKLNVIKNNYYKGQNKELEEKELKEKELKEKELKEKELKEKELKEKELKEKELKEKELKEKELKEESMEKELKTKEESI